MKLADILESDKEKILTELASAATSERAASIVKREFALMLYRYNQDSESSAARACASYLAETAGISSSFLDCTGDVRVYERGEGGPMRLSKKAVIFLMIGVLCLIAALITASSEAGSLRMSSNITTYLLCAAGAAAMYLTGHFTAKGAVRGKAERHIEIVPDAQAIYKAMRTMALAMDRDLEQAEAEETQEAERKKAEAGREMLSGAEVELFADMLEAGYSRDGEYALEKLGAIPYFLHRNGVEVVDYSGDAQMFDILPGREMCTIRPALVSEGKVLKKGLASGRR